ncbi:MAG: hypothetical protein RR602_00540 [Longicatena sp.]
MPITMNEKSKNLELNQLLSPTESYLASAWASIPNSTPILHSFAYQNSEKHDKIGSSNIYCYIGLTDKNLNIVTLNSLDVTRVTGRFSIPLEKIAHVAVKKGILKSSAILDFGNEKIKIFWSNQNAGTDMKDQRKNVKIICDHLMGIYEINET